MRRCICPPLTPGANAAVITSSMEKAQLAWESVQSAANTKKKKLRAASELQKFLSSVRGEEGREGMYIIALKKSKHLWLAS